MTISQPNNEKTGFFANRKTRVRNLFLLLLPVFVVMCVLITITIISIGNFSSGLSDNETKSSANEIEGMNIFLRDNATDLQKELFEKLKTAYKEGNDEEAARLTAESFIADLYTWTNKYGSYDVGGIYYCSDRYNVELYGRDTFYKYVSYYIEEYGSENLLEVTDVNASGGYVSDKKYTIDSLNQDFDEYYFEVSWEYADHPNFTEKEYCSYNVIVVIKSDTGRFEVVEAYG